MTAQALSKHFERVTIIERDHLPETPAARAGVPQAEHLHVMLPGGADAIESLLPGFAESLVAAGAVPVAAPTEFLWLNPAGWVPPFPARHRLLSASRDLIEWHTRRLVRSTPGVTLLEGRSVIDLCLADDGNTVTGVTLVGSASGDDRPVEHGARRPRRRRHRSAVAPARLAGTTRLRATRTRHASTPTSPTRRGSTAVRQEAAAWKAIFLQSQPPFDEPDGPAVPDRG